MPITYWDFVTVGDKDKRPAEISSREKQIPFLRYSTSSIPNKLKNSKARFQHYRSRGKRRLTKKPSALWPTCRIGRPSLMALSIRVDWSREGESNPLMIALQTTAFPVGQPRLSFKTVSQDGNTCKRSKIHPWTCGSPASRLSDKGYLAFAHGRLFR
jgi:hypothetical protein